MPLDKKHTVVVNKRWHSNLKRFFAMCKSAEMDADSTKNYYKKILDVQHMKDLTGSQWDFVFEGLEQDVKRQAEKDGVLFVKDLDEALEMLCN